MNASAEDEFDSVFAKYGGRLVPSQQPHIALVERARRLVDWVRRDSKTRANLPPLEIGIINCSKVNALAYLNDSGAFIGIFEGVILVLFDLFHRMLSYSTLFPKVGNPEDEKITEPTLLFPTDNADELERQLNPYSLAMPVVEERRAYARDLLLMAFDFVCLHEIAHVLHGHLGLLHERGLGLMLQEAGYGMPINPDFRQTLEMDADGFAVPQFLGAKWNLLKDDANRDSLFEEFVFQFTVAVYSTFRLFGFERNVNAKSHVGATSRRNMIDATVATWLLAKLDQDKADAAISRCADGIKACEDAFSAIFGSSIPVDDLKASFSPFNATYEAKVVANWRDLFPEIQRFAFTDRLVLPVVASSEDI